jgi:hypothetical protein
MTLKNIGARLENMRNQIPEKDKKREERKERKEEEKKVASFSASPSDALQFR